MSYINQNNFRVERKKCEYSYEMPTTNIHKNHFGIGLIISGDRKFITPDGIYFVHPTNISCVNKNLYHRTAPLSTEPYERYGVRFSYKMVERLIPVIGDQVFLNLMSSIVYPISPEGYNKTCGIFEDMLDEYNNPSSSSELVLEGMLHHLITSILKYRIESENYYIHKNNDFLIMQALQYIDTNFQSNPSALEVSNFIGLSYSQFAKRFKKATGSSYSCYINHVKIQYAQMMLARTNESINDISEYLGFCNANYFSKTFSTIVKMSPLKYRKANAQK